MRSNAIAITVFLFAFIITNSLFADPVKITPSGIQYSDNTTQTSSSPAYAQTIVVGPWGGDIAAGNSLQNALHWTSGATMYKPYLIKIEPGYYDLGTTPLAMRSYVDIEGSGIDRTFIKSSVHFFSVLTGAVIGANSSELRNLTVTVSPTTGTSTGHGVALYNNSASPSLFRVKLKCDAISPKDGFGIYNTNASPVLNHVTIDMTSGENSYGIYNIHDCKVAIYNSEISVTQANANLYGIYNYGTLNPTTNANCRLERVKINIEGSQSSSNNYGIYNIGNPSLVAITVHWSEINTSSNSTNSWVLYSESGYHVSALSSIFGGTNFVGSTGVYKCAYCSDSTYNPLNSNCKY